MLIDKFLGKVVGFIFNDRKEVGSLLGQYTKEGFVYDRIRVYITEGDTHIYVDEKTKNQNAVQKLCELALTDVEGFKEELSKFVGVDLRGLSLKTEGYITIQGLSGNNSILMSEYAIREGKVEEISTKIDVPLIKDSHRKVFLKGYVNRESDVKEVSIESSISLPQAVFKSAEGLAIENFEVFERLSQEVLSLDVDKANKTLEGFYRSLEGVEREWYTMSLSSERKGKLVYISVEKWGENMHLRIDKEKGQYKTYVDKDVMEVKGLMEKLKESASKEVLEDIYDVCERIWRDAKKLGFIRR